MALIGRESDSRASLSDLPDDPRDRALASGLFNGVVRWIRTLDLLLSGFSRRPLATLSPSLRNALRMGAFQLVFLGMPPHAAVNTVVAVLPKEGERAYCNACLRAMARRAGHMELPSITSEPVRYIGERYSYPDWIAERFYYDYGLAAALALCEGGNRVAPLTLRVNLTKRDRGAFLEELLVAGYDASNGLLPASVRVRKGRSVDKFPGYSEGFFAVQDEGATAVSLALGPSEGDLLWDVCAAPGGKTCHLAELVGPSGKVLATDIDESRLRMIEDTVTRMDLPNVTCRVLDARGSVKEAGAFAGEGFDGILVDAPCSGLGALRRNPDLRWNRLPTDIPEMAKRQKQILDSVSSRLKPGGTLVYSTCTLTREENEEVWTAFLSGHPDFHPVDPKDSPGGALMSGGSESGAKGYRYILPHLAGTDGFFVAKARKSGAEGGKREI